MFLVLASNFHDPIQTIADQTVNADNNPKQIESIQHIGHKLTYDLCGFAQLAVDPIFNKETGLYDVEAQLSDVNEAVVEPDVQSTGKSRVVESETDAGEMSISKDLNSDQKVCLNEVNKILNESGEKNGDDHHGEKHQKVPKSLIDCDKRIASKYSAQYVPHQ